MAITPEQAKNRIGRIGSSDVCKILGLSPYGKKSPEKQARDAYFSIMGLSPRKESSSMSAGNYLEPAILNWAQDHNRLGGRPFLRDTQIVHPCGYRVASFDGLAEDRSFVVEAKWIENPEFCAHWGRAGTKQAENVPDYVQVQVQWQMHIASDLCGIAYVAALRGIGGFGLYMVPRDEELIGVILERTDAFYRNHILTKTAPELPEGEKEQAA
jgi:predicted phage-related endonuclease